MQTDVSNVLSDLLTLSDTADQIIADSNFGNDQVGEWFSIIKETAVAIAKGTYVSKSTEADKSSCFSKDDLPGLVVLIKGKQNSRRVSNLLAANDNRARLSHRKSRKSLRKIVLGRSRSNQWKISNRKSSAKSNESIKEKEEKDEISTPIPKVKDKLLDSLRSPLNISNAGKSHSKSYFAELDSSTIKTSQTDFSTPIQHSKEILVPNTAETTPVTRSKVKFAVQATQIKIKKEDEETPQYVEDISREVNRSSVNDEFLTPENKIISINSDSSADKSSVRRSKRKSSIQHTQQNAKKVKCTNSSTSQVTSGKNVKWDGNFTSNNAFKQIKLAKNITPVIPGKVVPPPNPQTHPEKRILREIQKKEEKVNQNAKKIQSAQKMKIEENKKARELKMEKAMQLRLKMEKEKEERIRSRTQSKQENEPAPKKRAQRKAEAALKIPPKSQKPVIVKVSPSEQKLPKSSKNLEVNETYVYDPSPKEITNTKMLNALNATYVHSTAEVHNSSTPPPKPIRSAKKPDQTSSDKMANPIKSSSKELPNAATPLSSTPASKKHESKTKTPIMNKAKKPNSYAMTPLESSFVSYDISEIKSDDSDDEEPSHQKPIPSWASGIQLKQAIICQQYKNQINIDQLFGNIFTPPKLADIMGMEKKHYNKRTSSAIWLDSPNRSRTCNS